MEWYLSLLNNADVLLFKLIFAFVMSSEIVQESEWKKIFYSVSSLAFLRIERKEKRKYLFFIFLFFVGGWFVDRDVDFENCQK